MQKNNFLWSYLYPGFRKQCVYFTSRMLTLAYFVKYSSIFPFSNMGLIQFIFSVKRPEACMHMIPIIIIFKIKTISKTDHSSATTALYVNAKLLTLL